MIHIYNFYLCVDRTWRLKEECGDKMSGTCVKRTRCVFKVEGTIKALSLKGFVQLKSKGVFFGHPCKIGGGVVFI